MLVHRLACLPALICLLSCSSDHSAAESTAIAGYDTEIRWTSYGIPHVKANNWESLGYGFAYATATDAVCVIAQDIVMVNGNLSAYMGAENSNFENDVFHRALLTKDNLQRFALAQSDDSGRFARGYVAGYNRYLKDHDGRLPASCNDQPWVRPMVQEDVARLTVGLGIRYGVGRFKDDIARAKPPGEPVTAGNTKFRPAAGLGSNAVAFGKAVTETGRGILLGNPHYPWRGSSRFHLIHTTIPGVVDTMGVSLYTTNAVAIGFNKDIAWTHTVSTALRFTLYELELNPNNPLEYRYGDDYRAIETRTVSVDVQQPDGGVESRQHTVYSSHYGPIIVSDELPWTNSIAYAIRDAVIDNTASPATYAALSVAKSVDDIESAISLQGVYWTNTIATDRHGTAFYADISSTPNVDEKLLDECRIRHESIPAYIVVLDGARSECEWKSDPRSNVPGTLPAEAMPRIRRDDYVTNSNDSYWLANPESPLEGYSPIIGPERTARSLRTRAGLVFVREQLAKGAKLTADDMRNLLYNHRNYGAELLLDDVLKVCEGDTDVILPGDRKVDIEPSCTALAGWDRTANIDSGGLREALKTFTPCHSMRKMQSIRREVLPSTRRKSERLCGKPSPKGNSFWRTPASPCIQYATRNDNKIPIPGAQGWAGMFSMIAARLSKDRGYNPILLGNSYIQVISWDKDGHLQPTGILTYSQSQEPESAHYADLTELYSRGVWIDFPFTEDQILADPNLTMLTLTEPFD
jgi:acyl-homoserine-lactone acylase